MNLISDLASSYQVDNLFVRKRRRHWVEIEYIPPKLMQTRDINDQKSSDDYDEDDDYPPTDSPPKIRMSN